MSGSAGCCSTGSTDGGASVLEADGLEGRAASGLAPDMASGSVDVTVSREPRGLGGKFTMWAGRAEGGLSDFSEARLAATRLGAETRPCSDISVAAFRGVFARGVSVASGSEGVLASTRGATGSASTFPGTLPRTLDAAAATFAGSLPRILDATVATVAGDVPEACSLDATDATAATFAGDVPEACSLDASTETFAGGLLGGFSLDAAAATFAGGLLEAGSLDATAATFAGALLGTFLDDVAGTFTGACAFAWAGVVPDFALAAAAFPFTVGSALAFLGVPAGTFTEGVALGALRVTCWGLAGGVTALARPDADFFAAELLRGSSMPTDRASLASEGTNPARDRKSVV